MIILSTMDAGIVIDNVKYDIEIGVQLGAYKKKDGSVSSSGLEDYFNDYIDDQIGEFNIQAVGSALKFVESAFNFRRPELYYPAKDGSDMAQYQDDEKERFKSSLNSFLQDAIAMLQPEEEELDDDLADKYNRLRRNALERARYWRNKGVEIEDVPALIERGLRTYEDYQNLMNYIERVL